MYKRKRHTPPILRHGSIPHANLSLATQARDVQPPSRGQSHAIDDDFLNGRLMSLPYFENLPGLRGGVVNVDHARVETNPEVASGTAHGGNGVWRNVNRGLARRILGVPNADISPIMRDVDQSLIRRHRHGRDRTHVVRDDQRFWQFAAGGAEDVDLPPVGNPQVIPYDQRMNLLARNPHSLPSPFDQWSPR